MQPALTLSGRVVYLFADCRCVVTLGGYTRSCMSLFRQGRQFIDRHIRESADCLAFGLLCLRPTRWPFLKSVSKTTRYWGLIKVCHFILTLTPIRSYPAHLASQWRLGRGITAEASSKLLIYLYKVDTFDFCSSIVHTWAVLDAGKESTPRG